MAMFETSHMNMALTGTNQDEVLAELAKLAKSLGVVENEAQLVTDYHEREKESTTGFGNGVAIPHAKSNNVKVATILFGRSEHEIEWQSLDGKPVNTFISLLVPANAGDVHLKLLASLSRKLVHKDFVEILKNGDQTAVLDAINQAIS
ncbi:PTS fructose transporter subunit IIA [Lactiplantibacillus sp. WILCCON 0030]|uniref:PTS fructose transporter subunit IIA n=1 Tax=Lactiplantibacillus brownii TaxID=3069269 RepID=A0ABU1AER8_9LACO|nr:PTS fructose transporter subunit IIA [Lactiplantibacillus brownii]MDQ7938660.1 PTS fructose transporter subunit IIA [Lactiplantibacillus brownii]